MDASQNFTKEIDAIDTAINQSEQKLIEELTTDDPRHLAWIDYKALSGLVFGADPETGEEKLRKMPVKELADMLGVSREMLYQWQKSIPDFWQRVADRRKEIGNQNRLMLIEEKWFLKSLEMKNWAITESWLRHYKPDYKEARAKVEHEVGESWAALLSSTRKADAIEGEVTNDR